MNPATQRPLTENIDCYVLYDLPYGMETIRRHCKTKMHAKQLMSQLVREGRDNVRMYIVEEVQNG